MRSRLRVDTVSHVAVTDVNCARGAPIRVVVVLFLSLSEQVEAMLAARRRVEVVVQLRRRGDW